MPMTWIKKDLHVHESHSSDAPGATVEKYCRVAERRGINEICFTTHLILTGPDVQHGISPEKIPSYLRDIEVAQENTDVTLRAGLESDWFPEVAREIEEVLDEYPLDYALGSLHYVRGIDIGSRRQSPSFFLGKELGDALDIYFEEWGKAAESALFDVLSHPDYFRKYLSLTHEMPVSLQEYGSKVLDVFDILRSHGVGIGVNTSGYRHGIGDLYPIKGFMRAAREAGIETAVVGSDCHTVGDLGRNTLGAAHRLKREGFDHICVFEGRKSRRVSLSEVIG